ncbi:MAG TPA: MBL fold metallo-hydrolase [Anaerolineae bacterium]|nr:MBL fold metallo-hydrolase [Anaerolineae bacterium]
MAEKLEAVKAKLTILVDNTIMEFIPDSGMVKHLSGPQGNFLAEHGFSALIETEGAKVLVDTGVTGIAMEHNLGLLGYTMDDIDVIVFSHGHIDHTGGLEKVKGRIIAHPEVFYERYLTPKEGVKYDLTSPTPDPKKHKIEFHAKPVKLARGVMTTGEVPRKHEWEELKIFKRKEGEDLVEDKLHDDMGIVINTVKGLVVLQGCSHAGIINTVEAAKEITGVDEVYCVIGGLHLIGPGEKKIDRTIQEFKRLNIKKVIPIHCSGFEGIKQVSLQMPEQFEYCTVGCQIEF